MDLYLITGAVKICLFAKTWCKKDYKNINTEKCSQCTKNIKYTYSPKVQLKLKKYKISIQQITNMYI